MISIIPFRSISSLLIFVCLLCTSCAGDERKELGLASNIEVWWRKTSTRDNAADMLILRFRTKSGDYFLTRATSNFQTTPAAEASEIGKIISTALAKQKAQGKTPELVLSTTAFCYSEGTEYEREGWAIFYPDDSDMPEDVAHGLSWDKYPVIFAFGFTPNNLLKDSDKLVATFPLNWQARWVLKRDISNKKAATGP